MNKDRFTPEEEMSDTKPGSGWRMFRHPFSFNGRIRRLEYGISLITSNAALFVVTLFLADIDDAGYVFIGIILSTPLIWFQLAQGCKRCHDLGYWGWLQLIPLFTLVMLFYDGERGENEYGENPKNMD